MERPTHYKEHPAGIEVIEITEHMNFCLGNALKYILRAEHKEATIQDLEKAQWYLNREIERRKKELQKGGEFTANDFFDPKKVTPSSDFLECCP